MADAIQITKARGPLRWVLRTAALAAGLAFLAGCQLLGDPPSNNSTNTNTPVAVTGVAMNKGSLSLLVGASEPLAATVIPVNAANQSLTWSSSSSSFATVDANGVVTGVAAGTAVITVTTNEGGRTSTCTVTVTNAVVPVTGVSLKTGTTILVGDVEALLPTIVPADATDQGVSWSSDLPGVAAVNSYGVVTGQSAGVARITVTTRDGARTAFCDVTVSPVSVPVSGVTLNTSQMTLVIGGTSSLAPTVAPADATNQNVTWSSSDDSVATVDASGLVSALSFGTAVISVTTADGSFTADCTVTTVEQSTATVSFDWGTFQSIRFSQLGGVVLSGSETLTLSLMDANTGTQWQWFVDGVKQDGQTGDSYTFAPTADGFYTVSLTVVHDGILYSGAVKVTYTLIPATN